VQGRIIIGHWPQLPRVTKVLGGITGGATRVLHCCGGAWKGGTRGMTGVGTLGMCKVLAESVHQGQCPNGAAGQTGVILKSLASHSTSLHCQGMTLQLQLPQPS